MMRTGESSAVTPLFRALRRGPAAPAPQASVGGTGHPASVPGQCRAESLMLAVLTLGVFLTLSLDVTARVTLPWLRLLCAGLLCFLLPHFFMFGIAALLPPRGPVPSVRQAWIFLFLLTVCAALRLTLGPASDFAGITCTAWLVMTVANLIALPFVLRNRT
ncbi:MAG: hypothetical protein JWM59_4370 [Verrucomicrobiales bacterium]|nr:hypothetical protein [Verrucomicrobiales bacterium]